MARIERIGVLAYARCGEQDTLVPWEILKSLAWVMSQQRRGNLDVKLVGIEGETVTMQMGAVVELEGLLAPGQLFDLLYVPGGLGTEQAALDLKILDAVRAHHKAGKIVATNCSGIAILRRADILSDTPVTAAATVSRKLTREKVNVVNPRRMWQGERGGKIWSSAGGSAVHGSTVAMIANYFPHDLAETISMMWDTLPILGNQIFYPEGPAYVHADEEKESALQDAWEDKLLPEPKEATAAAR